MIKVAFYKASGTRMDKVVRWWTNSRYSHCAIILPGNVWWEASGETRNVRTFVKDINLDEWDIIDVPVGAEALNSIRRFCDGERGCFYDYVGIAFTQVIPLSFENPWWWFCSELVTACLQKASLMVGLLPHQQSPEDVYQYLRRTQ